MNSERTFALVVFATPNGGTHTQRVAYDGDGPSRLIPRAVSVCKRRSIDVANVLEIRRGKLVIFSPTIDLRFW